MHTLNIFALALFLTSQSFADSSCWPEEQLVGKTAKGFVEGINFKLQKVKSPVKRRQMTAVLKLSRNQKRN